MKGYIYKYTNNITGKCYVGQTIDIETRKKDHVYFAQNKPELPFHKALAKYGIDNFSFELLHEIEGADIKETLNKLEMTEIILNKAYADGYNCTKGGEGNHGLVHSEETRKIIGAKSRNRSPEANKKISDKLTGCKQTEERRQKSILNLKINAQPKAIEWHKSEEGLKWHKALAEKNKGKCFMPFYKHTCIECGKEFESHGKNSKYCCPACEQRYRRKHINKIKKICEYCGKEFMSDKYDKARFCSSSCANYAVRWK